MSAVENATPNDEKNLDISSPAADDQPTPTQGYHRMEFWKNLRVGVVEPADAETVLAATKDLCRHFVSQEDGPLFMEKAAKLAAQFRNLDDGRLSDLLVDHGGLQQLFTLDPNERLDLSMPVSRANKASDYSDVNVSTSFAYQTLADSDVAGVKPRFWSKLLSKKSMATQPVTICTGTSPDSDLRLSFCDGIHYKKRDQAWLEAFISSVDSLTESQALIFGPAFACPFVVLEKSALVSNVAKILGNVGSLLARFAPPKVAQIVAGLKVQMPPLKHLTLLLSVYAKERPTQVQFNTVVGGFMYADRMQHLSMSTRRLIHVLQLVTVVTYQLLKMAVVLFLGRMAKLAIELGHPRVADLYFAFVEQHFPESWEAYCQVRRQYLEVQPEAAEYDPFWWFSMAFSDSLFEEVSYRRNHRVCNISAVVLDLLQRPSKVSNWPILGPTYRSFLFLENLPKSMAISGPDAIWALDTYKVMRKEMRKPRVNRGWYWTCCPLWGIAQP